MVENHNAYAKVNAHSYNLFECVRHDLVNFNKRVIESYILKKGCIWPLIKNSKIKFPRFQNAIKTNKTRVRNSKTCTFGYLTSPPKAGVGFDPKLRYKTPNYKLPLTIIK